MAPPLTMSSLPFIRGPPSTATRMDQQGRLYRRWNRKNAIYARDCWDYLAGICVLMVAVFLNYLIASRLGLTSSCDLKSPVQCVASQPEICSLFLVGCLVYFARRTFVSL